MPVFERFGNMGWMGILFCFGSIALLQACLFGLGDTKEKGPYAYRGNFTITIPEASPWLDSDSDLKIIWKSKSLHASGRVSILLKSERDDLVLASDIPDSGSFRAEIRGRKLPSAEKFWVKIVDSQNETIFDYSSDFGIYPLPEYRLHFKDPAAGTILEFGGTCSIRVDILHGNRIPLAVSLFRNDSIVAEISAPTMDTAITWTVPNDMGTGANYRFKAACTTPYCRYEGWSSAFTISSPFSGSIVVASPLAADTLLAGETDTVYWTRNGNPGNVKVSGLYLDSIQIHWMEGEPSRKGDSEFVAWKIPARLMTSSHYRIGFVNVSDPGLGVSFSEKFTIKGVNADSFEKDDDSASARPLVPGEAPQEHTLHYGDQDWMRIESGRGRGYALLLKSDEAVIVDVRDKANVLYTVAVGAKAILLGPDDSGIRFAGVSALGGYSNSPAGASYSIALREVVLDSMGVFADFIDPVSGQQKVAGGSSAISWSPDPEIFGPHVKLDLFRDSTWIQGISGAIPNSGSFQWETDSWIMTSSRYRIRISDAGDPGIQGFSSLFSILGKTPDSFEPDDISLLAGEILPDAGIQMRSLTVSDTDRVVFNCAEGTTYEVSVESDFDVILEVVSSAPHFTGGKNPRISRIPGNGICRIRVTGGALAPVGEYALSVGTEPSP